MKCITDGAADGIDGVIGCIRKVGMCVKSVHSCFYTLPKDFFSDKLKIKGKIKMNYEELIKLGKQTGFTHVAQLNPATIELKPEVRQMCESNSCGMYGKSWSCPPACGTLDEYRTCILEYKEGILVQTVGELEDEFDGEGMKETEQQHKKYFYALYEKLREQFSHVLALGAGCCQQCNTCTYPDSPCRFPERKVSSMEACGMLVLQVCKDNHMEYYYGSNTIAYTSCFLLK
jgi:predicted metal-binding protein